MNESILPDGGPIYAETDLSAIIVEPWNAISSLFFLAPAFFCYYLIKPYFRTYWFITLAILLLAAGGIGSTVYHAFRSSPFFLALDVFPIQLLTLLVILYFWYRTLKSILFTILVSLVFLIGKYLIFISFPSSIEINLNYLFNGIMLFLPIVLYLYKSQFKFFTLILASIMFFAGSLLFRQFDQLSTSVLPMGTHWLWHIFSSIGSGLLGYYIYKLRKLELESKL